MNNVQIIYDRIDDIDMLQGTTVIATGPLTDINLWNSISRLIGEDSLYFYDAAAPIIDAETIDMDIAYVMDRYGEVGKGDYINLPMNEDEYKAFYNELISAKEATRHEFDKIKLFEGCMPIEYMAKRGEKTLVYGPLKPVGLR